jgi:hypothetical protein
MSNYRNRPKGDYIQEAEWEDLYKLTEEWQGNLEFQLFEIDFLERLIDTYFVKLLVQENSDELRELQIDLYQAKKKSKKLLKHVNKHLIHIADTLSDRFKYEGSVFRGQQEQLEDDVSEFITNQKVAKFTVIKMAKDVLENEKSKFIWKYN